MEIDKMKYFTIILTAALSFNSAVRAMDTFEKTGFKRSINSAFQVVTPKKLAMAREEAQTDASLISPTKVTDLLSSAAAGAYNSSSETEIFVPATPSDQGEDDDRSIAATPTILVPETPLEDMPQKYED